MRVLEGRITEVLVQFSAAVNYIGGGTCNTSLWGSIVQLVPETLLEATQRATIARMKWWCIFEI